MVCSIQYSFSKTYPLVLRVSQVQDLSATSFMGFRKSLLSTNKGFYKLINSRCSKYAYVPFKHPEKVIVKCSKPAYVCFEHPAKTHWRPLLGVFSLISASSDRSCSGGGVALNKSLKTVSDPKVRASFRRDSSDILPVRSNFLRTP